MPAFVDTGLNLAHVDDVAAGHLLALRKGRIGERYILGGENVLLSQMLADIAGMVGRKPPTVNLPRAVVYPIAFVAEQIAARVTGRQPFATIDGIRMSRYRMFFSDAKARAELGYTARPYREGLVRRDRLVPAGGVPRMSTPRTATETRSGKGHRDENFPVASHLIHPRTAARSWPSTTSSAPATTSPTTPTLSPERKIALLDGLADALTGAGPSDPEAEPLKRELAARGLPPRHALELLDAFRHRRAQEPLRRLGRADRTIAALGHAGRPLRPRRARRGSGPWSTGPSDAICAALQIINHLQDCGKDFRGPRPGLHPAGHASTGTAPPSRCSGGPRRSPQLRGGDPRAGRAHASGSSTRARCCPT